MTNIEPADHGAAAVTGRTQTITLSLRRESERAVRPAGGGWSFGRKLGVAFCVSLVLGAAALGVSMHELRTLAERVSAMPVDSGRVPDLRGALARERNLVEAYLVSGDPRVVEDLPEARGACQSPLVAIGGSVAASRDEASAFAELQEARLHELDVADRAIAARGAPGRSLDPRTELHRDLDPARNRVDGALDRLVDERNERLREAWNGSTSLTLRAVQRLVLVAGAAGLWAAGLGILLVRTLRTLRRRQAELSGYVDALEASNRDLDAFAGRIAHDLRNGLAPLGLVPAALRRCAARADAGEPIGAELERAASRTQRLSATTDGLIGALLAFSRGAQTEDLGARASVPTVVADVIEELGPLAARVDATIDRDVDDAAVRCSEGLLHIVVANLVGNALKYLEGRELRRVWISTTMTPESIEISVEDTGPGIPAAALGHIFEPFYRAPGLKVGGIGIGLATVRRIVDAHGGDITVESAIGTGSRFRVRLTRSDSSDVHRTRSSAPHSRPSGALI